MYNVINNFTNKILGVDVVTGTIFVWPDEAMDTQSEFKLVSAVVHLQQN